MLIRRIIIFFFRFLGYELNKTPCVRGIISVNYDAEPISQQLKEKTDSVKINVFFHKRCDSIPNSNLYRSIGLGGFKNESIDETDSAGVDNISHKNKHYCELTGIYYAWKNRNDSSIIGTAHYRRYLNVLPLKGVSQPDYLNYEWSRAKQIIEHPAQENKIISLLDDYDIIVPRAYYLSNGLASHYNKIHYGLGWSEFINQVDELYGRSNHGLRIDRRAFWGNIIIARKDLFDIYCAELFSVVDSVFDLVELPQEVAGARYQPFRYPAYLAERFMTAFINSHRLRYYEADLLQISGE